MVISVINKKIIILMIINIGVENIKFFLILFIMSDWW